MPGRGPRVIDILDGPIPFILMPLRCPAGLRAAIGEDPVQQDLGLLIAWQSPILEQARRPCRPLPVPPLGTPTLRYVSRTVW
ncbi:MAG: hypothetical protein M3M98_04175 [Nitrospirota bacterium]|nr:hypothetical protein [Nitrospirota bacterium]